VALREEELTSLCDDVDLDRDRALVERCQAGDSAAFGNLYARYYERLLRFCLRRLNDRHEAEDAAQEAFARAWKALPRFAGERRFYPWLTVIAGNICTDMLRRRSRSTPTDDLELTAQHPVGVVQEDTSEELVLASVDGELVHRALDRLSTRHRHVLAMREGSGWTYQQIADHEGVEIGTIETLLWRARQALKREFAVVSDSKEALAGFLIATGALIRRTIFRAAHRGATVHHNSSGGTGGSGAMRNAVAGVAVTGAAVAAAFIAPHALSSGPSGAAAAPGSALAAPPLVLGSNGVYGTESGGAGGVQQFALAGSGAGLSGDLGSGAIGSGSGGSGSGSGGSGSGSKGAGAVNSLLGTASASGAAGVVGGLNKAGSGLNNTVNGTTGGISQTVSGVTGSLGQTVSGVTGGVTGGLGQTVSGVTGGVGKTVSGVTSGVTQTVSGVGQTAGGVVSGVTNGVSGVTKGLTGGTGTTSGVSGTVGSVTSGVNGLTQGLGLGSVLPGTSGSGSSGSGTSSSPATTTTTTTTNPVQGILGGTTKTVGGLLGG
jgi:RNA polymerase sigma factor (sigma-70 family)